jgi:hypothetical protein
MAGTEIKKGGCYVYVQQKNGRGVVSSSVGRILARLRVNERACPLFSKHESIDLPTEEKRSEIY